jgi:hypothetical protein
MFDYTIHARFHISHLVVIGTSPKPESEREIAISEGNKETCSSCSLHTRRLCVLLLLLPKYAGETHAELCCYYYSYENAESRRLGKHESLRV